MHGPLPNSPKPHGRGCVVFVVCAMIVLSIPFWRAFQDSFLPHNHPPNYDRMMAAIEKKDAKAVMLILNGGFDPNTIPHEEADYMAEDDISPLNAAAFDGSTEIVRILLDHGANPNIHDGWHADPLSAATRNDSLDTMKLLLQRGAELNVYGGTGAALWRAAMDGKIRSVTFLLDHGATTTPGFIKILKETQGSPEIIRLLEKSLKSPAKKPSVNTNSVKP